MSVNIKNSSRLIYGELKLIDGIEFWDMLDLPVFVPQPNDIQYTTQHNDRLDLIAQQYYQDPLLVWVIAWANDIDFFVANLDPNILLVIPDPVYVKTRLLKGKVNSRV